MALIAVKNKITVRLPEMYNLVMLVLGWLRWVKNKYSCFY